MASQLSRYQPPVVGPPPMWGPLWQMGSGGRGTRPLCATDWLASFSQGHPGLAHVLLTLKVRWLTEAGTGTLASGWIWAPGGVISWVPWGVGSKAWHSPTWLQCPSCLPGTFLSPASRFLRLGQVLLSFLSALFWVLWVFGISGAGWSPALVHSCVLLWGLGGSQGLFGCPAVSPSLPPLGSLGVEGALLEPS